MQIVIFAIGGWLLNAAEANAQYNLEAMSKLNPRMPAPMDLDAEKLTSMGFRLLSSKHLDLWTDIPSAKEQDELPAVFDAAVPQWCTYFDIKESKASAWKVTGFLMRDIDRFREAGCVPSTVPRFPAGYNHGHHFWVLEQPGDYYTRHLVLHEGTHSFMQWFLGGSGPAWYSEGMAEMLGLHSWHNGELQLGFKPQRRDQVDYWGRPSLIATARKNNKLKPLDQVFDLDIIQFHDVESYAWSWAACEFFSRHPLTASSFAKMTNHAEDTTPAFSTKLKRFLKKDWPVIERDWKIFVEELTYGSTSDLAALSDVVPKEIDGLYQMDLNSAKSWQVSNIVVQAGESVSVSATGRFQIIDDRGPVPSEAQGITASYYNRHPLGMLMATVVGDDGTLAAPVAIGKSEAFKIDTKGRLAFRINECPARMDDNIGELQLVIKTGQ